MRPFAIDVIRFLSDPDLDQCMVAGVAAYTVGGMCTNTIGGAASTAVGLGYPLEAGEAISIKCGKAAIALLKDGTIAIAGGAIKMIGSDDVAVQGKNLHLNPGDTAPPVPPPTFTEV